MTEQERYSSVDIALLVQEMQVDRFKPVNWDGGFEVGQLIQLRLLLFPVKPITPVCC